MNLNNILTEKRNPNTMNIDELSSIDILTIINEEDKKVPAAVETILPEIADMVDKIVNSFQNGGRLIYVLRPGNEWKVGVLDASQNVHQLMERSKFCSWPYCRRFESASNRGSREPKMTKNKQKKILKVYMFPRSIV